MTEHNTTSLRPRDRRLVILDVGCGAGPIRPLVRRRWIHYWPRTDALEWALARAWDLLADYYNREVLSCLLAPLFPGEAKSVLLVLDPPSGR